MQLGLSPLPQSKSASHRPTGSAVFAKRSLKRFPANPITNYSASKLSTDQVHFGQEGSSSRVRHQHGSPTTGEQAIEETFFLPLAHPENPFTQKIHEMESDPAFRRAQKEYGGKLDNSPQAKFGKFALGSSLGFGAYFLSSITKSPVIGIMSGAAASPFFDDMNRGMVKLWHKPPHQVKRKAMLEDLETETQAGLLVREIGTEWPRLIEQEQSAGFSLAAMSELCSGKRRFCKPDETAALVGTALISRYPEQQAALKATLPKLRQSQLAHKFILPALQQSDSRTKRGYGACPEENRAHPGMEQAVETMLKLAEQEGDCLEQSIHLPTEKIHYENHLRHTLPRLIDYLSPE